MSETTSNKKSRTKSSDADTASDKKKGDEAADAGTTITTAKPAVEAPKEPLQQQATAPARKGGGGLMLLILLVLAAGAGGGLFLWQDQQIIQQKLAADIGALRKNAETLADRLDQVEQRAEKLQQQASVATQLEQKINNLPSNINAVKERQDRLDKHQATLAARQATLEEAFDKLRREVGNARSWNVEEIAAILQIANDRLHLEGNIDAALAALRAADQHLLELKNPSLVDIRRLIAEEITALQATAHPDITGMALSLDALAKEIDRLPMARSGATSASGESATVPAAEAMGWRAALHDVWEKLKGLVVIKRRSEVEHALLAPDERYFLRQNLRLKLESARLALLQRNSQLYQDTLNDAQQWIKRYFDVAAPATAGALDELTRLQQTEITPKLPDISASQNALRDWLKQRRQRQTEASQS